MLPSDRSRDERHDAEVAHAPSERGCRGPEGEAGDSRANAVKRATRPARLRQGSGAVRRSISAGGSEATKRRARECVGGLGAKPPDKYGCGGSQPAVLAAVEWRGVTAAGLVSHRLRMR
jgi:hypothetical protein